MQSECDLEPKGQREIAVSIKHPYRLLEAVPPPEGGGGEGLEQQQSNVKDRDPP